MKRLLLFLGCASLLSTWANAQIGGDNVFEFLNLSPSARITALGGHLITVRDADLNLGLNNPALLNPAMDKSLSFNHNFYVAGIQSGYAAFAFYNPKADLTFQTGMQYTTYGEFDGLNEFGESMGSFKASEYAFQVGAGKTLYERMAVGANVKMVASQLESYNAYGVLADLGATYFDTAGRTTVALVFKNMGVQLNPYRQGNREPLPFEIQAGISHRLKYLPFRLSVVYRHLQRWNILYDDPNSEESVPIFGQDPSTAGENFFVNNFFQHFVFSGEFLLGADENLRLRAGYNHQGRSDLSVDNYRSLAGFSFGVGVKISHFLIDYGWGIRHFAGGLNHVTLSTNLKSFSNRKILD